MLAVSSVSLRSELGTTTSSPFDANGIVACRKRFMVSLIATPPGLLVGRLKSAPNISRPNVRPYQPTSIAPLDTDAGTQRYDGSYSFREGEHEAWPTTRPSFRLSAQCR